MASVILAKGGGIFLSIAQFTNLLERSFIVKAKKSKIDSKYFDI